MYLTDSKAAENPTSTNLEGWEDPAQRLDQFPDATKISVKSDKVPVSRLRVAELQHLSDNGRSPSIYG